MPSCQWREKPGLDPVCKMLPDDDGEFCPRHAFMDKVRQKQQHAKNLKAAMNKRVVTKLATTRRELLEQGFQATGNGNCRMCNKPVLWFRTPNGKSAPYELMPELDSPAVSHFATCPFERQFRRSA